MPATRRIQQQVQRRYSSQSAFHNPNAPIPPKYSQQNNSIGIQRDPTRSRIVDPTALASLRRAVPIYRQTTHSDKSSKGRQKQQRRPQIIVLWRRDLELLIEVGLSSAILLLWRRRSLAVLRWLLGVLLGRTAVGVGLVLLVTLRRVLRLLIVVVLLVVLWLSAILHAIALIALLLLTLLVIVGVGLTTVLGLIVGHCWRYRWQSLGDAISATVADASRNAVVVIVGVDVNGGRGGESEKHGGCLSRAVSH